MKITDVSVTLWEWKDIPATRYTLTVRTLERHNTQMGLVKISTDEGIDGYSFIGSSFASAQSDAQLIINVFKPMIMGEDPLARERIWQSVTRRFRGQRMPAVGGIDVALWDLAGRAAGAPIHRLMGSYRNSVQAYASSAVLPTPEAYAEEAVKIKESGWSAYKLGP